MPSLRNYMISDPCLQRIQEEFRGLRWMPLQPKHLDYANAQFLLIGEASGELGRAVEPTAKDQKHEKETPQEEVEKLEDEDSHRADALKGKPANCYTSE